MSSVLREGVETVLRGEFSFALHSSKYTQTAENPLKTELYAARDYTEAAWRRDSIVD